MIGPRWPALLALLLACGAGGCRRAATQQRATAPPLACGSEQAPWGIALELRPLIAEGLPPGAGAELAQAIESWAACDGVRLRIRSVEARPLPIPFARRRGEIEQLPVDEARRALFGPLAGIIAAEAPAGGRAITVALLADLAPPDSAAAGALPDLTGLGLARGEGARGDDTVGGGMLPADHAPLVLLSFARWRLLSPAERSGAIAHEIGHALGLAHDGRGGNRMNPQAGWPGWLDEAQRAVLASATLP